MPMSFLRTIKELYVNRVYYPEHFYVVFRDFLSLKSNFRKDISRKKHLDFAIQWLCYAQDVNKDGGCSARYQFEKGWDPSYPETTGYIIPTFFDLYYKTRNNEFRDRAIRMCNWELAVQMSNGAFPGNKVDAAPTPVIFNTGQIIFGLNRTYIETNSQKYLHAAEKAANWLVSVQGNGGEWDRYDFENTVHVYNTRTAWAILELYAITKSEVYRDSAIKNLEWALNNQLENGWFKNNSFGGNDVPVVHIIAYTTRGLLESGIILNEPRYIKAAQKTADVLLKYFEDNKFLAGEFDSKWTGNVNFSCLTGDAQIAINWLRLYGITNEKRYLNAGIKMNDYLCSLQDLKSRNRGIRGGIKGSHPIWGTYEKYRYPNWAVKFFIDTLLLEEECLVIYK